MFSKENLFDRPVLIFTLLMLLLICSGFKTYSNPPQVLDYHTCTLGLKTYLNDKFTGCKSLSNSENTTITKIYQDSTVFVFDLRYKVFKPSFVVAEKFLIDLNFVSSFQILIFFFFILFLLRFCVQRFGRVDFWVSALFVFLIFLFMNGRLVPSLLGMLMMIVAAMTMYQSRLFALASIPVASLGLFLGVMSTGFYVAALTFYFWVFLTKAGIVFRYDEFSPLSKAWRRALVAIHFLIFLVATTLLVPLGIRLYSFYGGGMNFFTGSFKHGIGKYLIQSNSMIAFSLMICLATIVVLLLLWKNRIKLFPIFVQHWDSAAILFLAIMPLPFIIFGHSAAVPSVIGFALLSGRLTYLSRMWLSRYIHSSENGQLGT